MLEKMPEMLKGLAKYSMIEAKHKVHIGISYLMMNGRL